MTPPQLGPARFQRPNAPRRERAGWRAFGAGLVLVVLVIGLPAALWWLDGPPPVPTSLPTREDLTAVVGVEQLITVLVAVAWLAWLQFTVCVLVELRSAVSGVGLPSRVPLSGPSQRFARALVGSVLLAATAVGPAAAAVSGPPAAPTATAALTGEPAPNPAPASDQAEVSATVHASDAAEPTGDVTYRLGDVTLEPDEAAGLAGRLVYRVQPPEGRYHDNLWDIAERHLGDGRRYKEIFELNRGRTQPDGHELTLARLIYPDWLLIMPEDATGLDRVTAVPQEQRSASAEPDPATNVEDDAVNSSAPDGPAIETAATVPDVAPAEAPGARADTPDGAGGPGGQRELVTAGLLAAGLLASIEVVRRRRRTPEPAEEAVETEVAVRIGADPDRARLLDRSLRQLASACQQGEHQLALPPVYAAMVDDAGVELLVAPPAEPAPAPWEALDGGRRWRYDAHSKLIMGDVGFSEAVNPTLPMINGGRGDGGRGSDSGGVVAPFPGLVSVGRDPDGRDVLVDLEAASGPIAVTGDPAAAYEVVTALATELATNCWSDDLQVTGVGLPAELAALEPSRYRELPDVAPVLAEFAAHEEADSASNEEDVVLTGRVSFPGPGGGAQRPHYLVLGSVVPAEVAEQLRAVTAQRAPLAVVCAGELPGARWRFTVDAAGNLELPALGLRVTANRLSRPTAAALATLIAPDASADGAQPGALHEAWLPEARPEAPLPPSDVDAARLATAPVRVFVLGPAEVQAPGPIEPERVELATEIVVYLALHPGGVHPTVLAAAVWPHGVTAEVCAATLDRVREWLGADPEGSPHLRGTADGRLQLSGDVVLDWDVVQTLLARSRSAGSAAEEIDLLRRALRVARGPVLSEWPRGRYSWIARARLERRAADLLVDAAHRMALLCHDAGELATAAAAARAGIRVRPGEQLLWRDLLLIEHDRDGRDGVLAAADELTVELGRIGVAELEPETMALLEELLPAGGDVSGSARSIG